MVRKSTYHLPPPADDESGADSDISPVDQRKLELGRRIDKLLTEKGWTQSELARRAHVGRDAVSNYVRGLVFPTPKSLRQIAGAFGVSEDELLPDRVARALDDEIPSLEIKQASGHPDICWLRVSQRTTLDQALRIATILRENETNGTAIDGTADAR